MSVYLPTLLDYFQLRPLLKLCKLSATNADAIGFANVAARAIIPTALSNWEFHYVAAAVAIVVDTN